MYIIQKYYTCISFSEVDFVLANSGDPDEMPHYGLKETGKKLNCIITP